ncbi:MAG: FlgD immunoglobulin-like domain containing protein [Candidatus Eisenbacteria bacterium]|nr:FlgD immunoglobulin-like domain containing protein [Candidatus Eisenbacteria bacterium]
MKLLLTRLSIGAALLAGLLGPAGAFAPPEARTVAPIPRPGSQAAPQWRTESLSAARHPAAALFEERSGGRWRYQWNTLTGTPHAVYGPGYASGLSSIGTAEEAEAAARRFLAENQDLLRVDPTQMELFSARGGLGKYGVVFRQRYHGVEVEEARAKVLLTEKGIVSFFGSDWYPDIAISTSPSLGEGVARDIAGRAIGFVPGRDKDEGAELRILPVPAGEASLDYRLVWKVRQEIADPYAIWVSYVDARDGRILWRYDDVHYVNVVGTTDGDVEDFGYCYGEQPRVLPHMKVNVTGGGNGYSDANGNFTIANAGSDPVTVTAQLDGRWINVNDVLDGDGTYSGTAIPGVPFDFHWTDNDENDAARDIYLHGNRIHDIMKLYDPGFTGPDYRMSANANIASTCNAFWNGSSINFYRAGGGCANTGQMGDVIYHEYGHGITQWIYGYNPDDVGEGNSDIAALLIDGNPIVGEGFYQDNCVTGIRTADNDMRYPDDYAPGDIHGNGQIVSGFWWDARERLVPQIGEEATRDLLWTNWHFGRVALQPLSMPDQILTAFLMDDDDGDLTNGTPNYYAYCPAAEHHGFDTPAPAGVVQIDHLPLHNQVYDGNPETVVAIVTASGNPIDPSSVQLQYRVDDGGPVLVAMLPTGNPDEYAAQIPALPVGRHVDYTMTASDVLGNGGAYPPSSCTPDEPNGAVRYYVATSVEEMEADSGWTVGSPQDDATTGIWTRVDPNGTPAQPEDDVTAAPGVMAWVTGQGPPGGQVGEQDIDGGLTTLTSPAYDLSGATSAKVVYYRWYSNDKGADPGNDFWVVDASNDNGANWTNVENTRVSFTWTPNEVDLNALFGQTGTVRFRFLASDEGAGSVVEAALDEFLVFVDYALDAPEPTAGGVSSLRFAFPPAHPNPSAGATEVSFEIPAAAPVTVRIHDVSGKLVRSLSDGASFSAGQNVLSWDGKDGSGRDLPSGVYYAKLVTRGFQASRPIILTR